MSQLTVVLKGNEAQIATALRELAKRVDTWGSDHAPMGSGQQATDRADYHARWDDWEYAEGGGETVEGGRLTGMLFRLCQSHRTDGDNYLPLDILEWYTGQQKARTEHA